MPRRAVAFVLLAFSAAALGTWAGTALSAVPPVPTVSVPTVTIPLPPAPPMPAPVPLPPPPPAVTVPPKVEPPPLPPPPPTPAVPPVPAPALAPTPTLPDLRGGDASSVTYARKVAAERARARRRAARAARASRRQTARARAESSEARRAAAGATRRAPRAGEVAAAVQGAPEEDAGLLAPVASTLEKLSDPGLPGALFAMAALAAALLGIAAMPAPISTSRAGATLVHKRGAIALAGGAAFAMAVATYLLL